jgi:hypothetical protein
MYTYEQRYAYYSCAIFQSSSPWLSASSDRDLLFLFLVSMSGPWYFSGCFRLSLQDALQPRLATPHCDYRYKSSSLANEERLGNEVAMKLDDEDDGDVDDDECFSQSARSCCSSSESEEWKPRKRGRGFRADTAQMVAWYLHHTTSRHGTSHHVTALKSSQCSNRLSHRQ